MLFNKGLNRDNTEQLQPEGTYRDLQNGILAEELGAVINEKGTTSVDTIPAGFEVIGAVNMTDERLCIFSTDGTDSEIGIFDGSSYSTVLNDQLLSFDATNPIKAVFRKTVEGNDYVYWTDGNNPPRWLDLSNAPASLSDGDELNLFSYVGDVAEVDVTDVNDYGGRIVTGSYYIALSYIADDGTETNYFYVSPPIYINDEDDVVRSADVDTINIADYDFYDFGPRFNISEDSDDQADAASDGAPNNTPTSKSISFDINNIDTSYDKLRIAIIKGNRVRVLPDVKITDSNTISYTYTGNESSVEGSLDDIIINNASYNKAQTITESNNTLYLGNLEKADELGYQKFANNIKVNAVTQAVGGPTAYGDQSIAFELKSFRRDEIYAFYISFILKDGTESEAYHIPGRAPYTSSSGAKASGIIDFSGGMPAPPPDDAASGVEDITYSIEDTGAAATGGGFAIANELFAPAYENETNETSLYDRNYQEAPADTTFNIRVTDDDDGTKYPSSGWITVTVNEGDDIRTVLQNITDSFNVVIGTDWRIIEDDDAKMTLEAVNDGSVYNNCTVEFDTGADAPPFGYDILLSNSSGGSDSNEAQPDHDIFFDFPSTSARSDFTVSVTNIEGSDTAAQLATKYANALNGDGTFSANFTASVTNSTELNIDADQNSADDNCTVTITDTDDSSLLLTIDVTGGFSGDTNTPTDSKLQIGDNTVINLNSIQNDDGNDLITYDDTGAQVATRVAEAFNSEASNAVSDYYQWSASVVNTDEVEFFAPTQEDIYNGLSLTYFGTNKSTFEGNANTDSTIDGGDGFFRDPQTNVPINETETITSGHPIADNVQQFTPTKFFHFAATPTPKNDDDARNNGMGYWENKEERYPNTDDWDIYDVDGNGDPSDTGNTLRGEQVRHHRFPSHKYEPYFDGSQTHTLGIKLENVKIPTSIKDKVKGIRIHYAKKDVSNSHIIDQSTALLGADGGANAELNGLGASVLEGLNDTYTQGLPAYDITSDLQSDIGIDYQDLNHNRSVVYLHPFEALRRKLNLGSATHVKMIDSYTHVNNNADEDIASNNPIEEYRTIKGISYLDRNQRRANLTAFGFSEDMDNVFGEAKIAIELNKPLDSYENYVMNICQLQQDIHRSFDQQELAWTGYQETNLDLFDPSSGSFIGETPDIYGGDNYICQHDFVAKSIFAPYAAETLTDAAIKNIKTPLYDLVPILSVLYGSKQATKKQAKGSAVATIQRVGSGKYINNVLIPYGYTIREVVESRDNITLRNEGDTEFQRYSPKSEISNPDITEQPDTSGLEEKEKVTRILRWWHDNHWQQGNYIGYNQEYSDIADIKPAFPKDKFSSTITRYPTRIIRSGKDSVSRDNSYRRFKEADFFDLPKNRGELINLASHQNTLVPHMESGIYRTRGREEVTVEGIRAFIGAGDIFSVQPDELVSTDEGFGGIQDFRTGLVTKFGYFFVDQEARKVFLLTNKLEEISARGMGDWFYENLDLSGSGELRAGYDPEYERIILVKDDGSDSWTISYMPQLQAWVSFHDYQPDKIFHNKATMFASVGNTIYSHHTGSTAGDFYGSSNDFEIEFVDNPQPPIKKTVSSLLIDANFFDGNGDRITEETFNNLQITNSYQDTGELTIVYFENMANPLLPYGTDGSDTDVPARKTDGYWKINKFRDTNNTPSGAEDIYPDWHYNKRLKDKYHVIRLKYDNGNDLRLISSQLITRQSNR